MPNEKAFADCDDKIIYYRESTRYDLKNGSKEARFIFLEEIGHIVLGHKGIRNRSSRERIYEKSNFQVNIDEREARRFAAAVLAPFDRIKPEWDAIAISQEFQISFIAAEFRKQEFDKWYRTSRSISRELPQCAIDFLQEAKNRGYPVKARLE